MFGAPCLCFLPGFMWCWGWNPGLHVCYVSILQTELHPHPLLKDISFLCCQLSPGVKLHSYPQAGHSPSATCLVLQDKKVLKVGD